MNKKKNNSDNTPRILKQFGYYCTDHIKQGKKPEDMDDIDLSEVERIVNFLKKHPINPRKKERKKINYKDYYYLGESYGLKHVVERFLSPLSYCANGDFIAACEELGYGIIPNEEGPNASIYIPCEYVNTSFRYYIVADLR